MTREDIDTMAARCGLTPPAEFRAPSEAPHGRRGGLTTMQLLQVLILAERGERVLYVGTKGALAVYRAMLARYADAAGIDISRVRFADRLPLSPAGIVIFDHHSTTETHHAQPRPRDNPHPTSQRACVDDQGRGG